MTRNLYLAATAAAAFAFASPALAQDASSANPAPAGFRIEVLGGWDRVGLDDVDAHDSGFLYGLGAGYDLSLGGPVSLGVDGEISDSTAKKFGVKTSRDLYAGGRVNIAVAPRANLYVKGGYTNARFKAFDDSDTIDGFRIGAGGQYQIAGNTYVGAEYRYSNYEFGVDRNQIAMTLGTRF